MSLFFGLEPVSEEGQALAKTKCCTLNNLRIKTAQKSFTCENLEPLEKLLRIFEAVS